MERILVAAERSGTRAVDWAAELAERYGAELLVVEVVAPEHVAAGAPGAAPAEQPPDERFRRRRVYDSDEAAAIVRVAEEEHADVIVVGGAGMSDRTEFLLASVPNRVSHTARCSVVIVGSEDGARPAPAPEAAVEEPTDSELLARAARIGRVLASYAFGSRGGDAESRARRLRTALEQLGPTFGKLGQILSTRPDLLPPELVQELSELQDRVTPLTEAEVVAVMERELRVPWEDVFASIEPDPLAAGTIAQVHRAVLGNGDRVVVKVQRPTAEEQIAQDLGLLERFGAVAAERPAFRQLVDVPAIIDHLSTSLRRELDFRNEAANIERMREVLEPFDRLDVPHVYDELSTAALLVMEEIQGVPVLEAPDGDERRDAARQLLEAYYQQVLSDGFFHADPHPGNLLWANDKVYLLDLGMTGAVEPGMRESLLLMLLAFWQQDAPFLADVMLTLSGGRPHPDFDAAAFEAELAALVDEYRHVSMQELRLGPMLQQLTEIAVQHDVRLPAELALIGKAFGQMQLTAAELDPTLDPFSVAANFFLRRIAGQVRTAANPQKLFYDLEKLRVRATRVLEGVERLATTPPAIDARTRELEHSVEQAGRRVALAFAAAAALLGTAIAAGAAHAAGWTTGLLGAIAGVLSLLLAADVFRNR
jgi:predicted unusual protein kinase regulating ubiquinone biosynthesis (AarF/ABC1/UbiB family)/nucleotide-binding universal stress UspA family protein